MIELALYVGGITQVVKMTKVFPNNWLPAVAVIVGVVMGFIQNPTKDGALAGLLIGLTTTGLVNRADETAEKAGMQIMAEDPGTPIPEDK